MLLRLRFRGRVIRTTLASSDAEAVFDSIRHNTALPVEVASELVCRLRLALDQRRLPDRNRDAVRTILQGLALTMDERRLIAAVRSRLVKHAHALGLDRVPSDPVIRRYVRAEGRKISQDLSRPSPGAVYPSKIATT